MTKHLLDSEQMATFVAEGFLIFDGLIPEELNRICIDEILEHGGPGPRPWDGLFGGAGADFDTMWADSPGLGRVFREARVRGILESLLGPRPLYDHHFAHVTPPLASSMGLGSTWHNDALIDTVNMHFQVSFLYFPHDTPREMGGTMLLPGSHLRAVSSHDVAKHQNFVGQTAVVCPAGTFIAVHQGAWHCAQPNRTDTPRLMFKLRLGPSTRQLRMWDTSDIADPEVGRILGSPHPWTSYQGQLEVVNRLKLWRYLTGDADYDVAYTMTRMKPPTEQSAS